jgi:quercetin dioxygenase-like cupin family protein
MNETIFRTQLAALGCNELRLVEWAPGHATQEHAHDFNAHGLILKGAFTLTSPAGPRLLGVGDTFELAAGTPHTETVGAEPTQVLAGRIFPA